MPSSDINPEGDAHHTVGMSPTEFREVQERQRERQELNHALRNFAEHFGAEEVFEQAKAIYLETQGGQSETTENAADASWASLVRDASQSVSERQKKAAPGRPARRGSPALEDAKRLLGG